GLHELSRRPQHTRSQSGGGQAGRFPAHHRDARGECTHSARDAIRLTMRDANIRIVDSQGVSADLRDGCLHALTDRGNPGDNLDRAVLADLDTNGVEWPKSAFLNKHRDAGTNFLAVLTTLAQRFLKFGPAGSLERLVEQERVVARIVDNLRSECFESEPVRHRTFADEVALADFYCVQVHFRSNCVQQPFADKRRFVAAGRAIGPAWRLVGQPNAADGAVSRNKIGSGQHGGREVRNGRRMSTHISAVIVEEFVLDTEYAPPSIDRGAHTMMLFARMVGGDQMLAAVLDPLYWTFEIQRGGANQNVFRIDFPANAEPTADVTFIQLHGFLRAAQH